MRDWGLWYNRLPEPIFEGVKDRETVQHDRMFNIKPAWLLTGGCLFLIIALTMIGMAATLGWFIPEQVGDAAPADSAADEAAPQALQGNPVGQPAPLFTLPDMEGNPVSLRDFRGRPVLLNFWATWCGPCRAEMPIIEEAYQKYKDQGFVVLAIDVQENPEVAQAFAGWLGMTFSILDDGSGNVSYQYRVRALPTSFFVDRKGVIRGWESGAMSRGVLERHLAKILP